MTDPSPASGSSTRGKSSGAAVGFTVFASLFLTMVGFFHLVEGIVELADNNVYSTTARWAFRFGGTTWGWIHIIVGCVVIVAALALFSGAVWARTVAVLIATVSIVANFLWLPYYPLWALLIIALDVIVIWAVTFHGRDIADDFDDMA